MKLFRDYAVLASGQVAGRVLGFVTFAWLARALDPAGYAAVEFIVGLSVFFGALVEGGFSVVAVRRSARAPAELPRLAQQIPWLRLGVALLAVPLMVLAAVHISRAIVPPALAWLFALSLLAIPWRQDWLLQAQERMGQAALSQLVKPAVFAVVVLAWVHSPASLALTGAAELAGAMCMTAYCLYVQHRAITPVRLRGALAGSGSLTREAVVVGLGNLLVILNQYVPLFMSAPMAGAPATAAYAAAARIVGALIGFNLLYHYSLYPAVARATARNDAKLAALLRASCRVTAWGGIFGALAVTVLAREVVIAAFGAKLASAAPVLQVLIWMLAINLVSGHARFGLIARGAQADVLAAQAAGLGTTVALGAILGARWGATGFAAATVIGAVIVWAVAQRQAHGAGAQPPPMHLVLRPLACAGATLVGLRYSGLEGWWALLGLLPYVIVAPVLDRALIGDLRVLAHAKADLEPGGAPPG